MKGLIIDEPWISLIVSGQKTWEMRPRDTQVRGRIGLIRKKSKAVIGRRFGRYATQATTIRASCDFVKHRFPKTRSMRI